MARYRKPLLPLALSAPILAACAVGGAADLVQPVASLPQRAARLDRGDYKHQITIGVEDIEYDELTLSESGIEVDLPDVERTLYPLRYRGGSEAVGFHVGVFFEEFGEDFDMFGAEVGVDGAPRLMPDSRVSPIVDYDLDLSFHFGDADTALPGIGTASIDLYYGEVRVRVGGGVDFEGVQVSAGLAGSALYGFFDVEEFGVSETLDLDGTNVGGYARAAYAATHVPVFGELIGYAGDLSGVAFNVGTRF